MLCRNGILETGDSPSKVKMHYDNFRTAIEDGLLPIRKAIGFRISCPGAQDSNSAVDRNISCRETMLQLSKNISRLTFVNNEKMLIATQFISGNMTSSNAGFISNGKPVTILESEIHLMHCFENTAIHIVALEAKGSRRIEENAKVLKESKSIQEGDAFFPVGSEHALTNLVRVLPLTDGVIRYRCSKELEPQLNEIWNRYIGGC